MELTHDFVVPASIDAAWATFMDLEGVGSCFPGATVTEATGDTFAGTVKVKLGPIALVYAGAGQFLERDDAAYRAVIEAKGKDKRGNGTAGASVVIQLAPADGGGHTRVDVTTELAITGKPAQFGRGVMQDVSDKLLAQFVSCIEGKFGVDSRGSEISAPAPVSPSPPPGDSAPPVASAPPGASPPPGSLAPPGASPGRPATPRPAAAADDSIDLGVTVLPVLVKSYAPYVIAGVVGLAIGLALGRRRA